MPFFDNFDDMNAADGMPGTWVPGAAAPGGDRDASSGDFTVTHSGTVSTYVEELTGLRDVSIRTQLRLLNWNTSASEDSANLYVR